MSDTENKRPPLIISALELMKLDYDAKDPEDVHCIAIIDEAIHTIDEQDLSVQMMVSLLERLPEMIDEAYRNVVEEKNALIQTLQRQYDELHQDYIHAIDQRNVLRQNRFEVLKDSPDAQQCFASYREPSQKISGIKALREQFDLGLKEAKDLYEHFQHKSLEETKQDRRTTVSSRRVFTEVPPQIFENVFGGEEPFGH